MVTLLKARVGLVILMLLHIYTLVSRIAELLLAYHVKQVVIIKVLIQNDVVGVIIVVLQEVDNLVLAVISKVLIILPAHVQPDKEILQVVPIIPTVVHSLVTDKKPI